jgi:DNA-directed RNA polymerase subunit RPC12/RpoP
MSVLGYKCPSCGGTLLFESESQQMKCPYCDSEFNIKDIGDSEDPGSAKPDTFRMDSKELMPEERAGMVVYSCPSCGGEIVGDNSTAASFCLFCGNTAIMPNQLTGMLRPDLIIPFKVSKENAQNALKAFYKGKTLLPSIFHQENRIECIRGIYVPFWLFDCETHATIRYKAANVRVWSDKNYNYTKTDYYNLFREGDVKFERLPANASSKMDSNYMESIEPYSYNEATEFNMAYLSGYFADKHDVDSENARQRADQRFRTSIVNLFKSTCSGYSTCPESTHVKFSHGKICYALMPVWMLNTKYEEKIYQFAMNGQTGKFTGTLPVSWPKFFLWFFSIFFGVGLIGTLIVLMI